MPENKACRGAPFPGGNRSLCPV